MLFQSFVHRPRNRQQMALFLNNSFISADNFSCVNIPLSISGNMGLTCQNKVLIERVLWLRIDLSLDRCSLNYI